jgi:hypothetical protein
VSRDSTVHPSVVCLPHIRRYGEICSRMVWVRFPIGRVPKRVWRWNIDRITKPGYINTRLLSPFFAFVTTYLLLHFACMGHVSEHPFWSIVPNERLAGRTLGIFQCSCYHSNTNLSGRFNLLIKSHYRTTHHSRRTPSADKTLNAS